MGRKDSKEEGSESVELEPQKQLKPRKGSAAGTMQSVTEMYGTQYRSPTAQSATSETPS